jgi:homoserine kinase type II
MATFTALVAEDAQRIATAHGLGTCVGVIPIAAGTVNSNYFIDAERGRFFVRLYEQQDVDGVAYEWDLLAHLKGASVPLPARVTGPAPGEVRVSGKPVAVFEQVVGQDLCQRLVTRDRVHAVGAALARAARVGQRFATIREGRFELSDVARLLDEAEAAGRPELSSVIARLRMLRAEIDGRSFEALPRGVVHGDLFRDNVLWVDERIVALLDWESASDGVLVYDLAVCMLAWCCGDALDLSLAEAMVTGYRTERELTAEEWEGLWWQLRMGCLRFATTRIIDVYLKGIYPPGYKDYRRFLARLDVIEGLSPRELETRLRR